MEEKWIRWEPTVKLTEKYYSQAIYDTPLIFEIHLIGDSKQKVIVSFPTLVAAYRSTNDSFVYDTLEYLDNHYGSAFYAGWTFFKVENSEYLEWIKKQSVGTFDIYNLQHFCIFTVNAMIDVIASGEPLFYFPNQNKGITLKEKWIRWEPISNLSNKYYVETITQGTLGLVVVLHSAADQNDKIRISFSSFIEAYRSTDVNFISKTSHFLQENYDLDFYEQWTFFKVENSQYLEWLKQQSSSISPDIAASKNFTHFCIFAADFMIDIAANYEPEVSHIA